MILHWIRQAFKTIVPGIALTIFIVSYTHWYNKREVVIDKALVILFFIIAVLWLIYEIISPIFQKYIHKRKSDALLKYITENKETIKQIINN